MVAALIWHTGTVRVSFSQGVDPATEVFSGGIDPEAERLERNQTA